MDNFLKEFREKAGLSAEQLAKSAKTSRQQIYRLEKGDRSLSKEWAERLAPFLNAAPSELMFGNSAPPQMSGEMARMPVVGEVAAGTWVEVGEAVEHPTDFIIGPTDIRFPANAYFALIVRGDSINRIARDGTYLMCLDIIKADVAPSHNDIVIVQRTRADGSLIETTAKVLRINGDKWELWPDSDNPKYSEPVILMDGDSHHDNDEVRIIAIATGTYSKLARNHF